jgi:hypothetical protein
MNLKNKIEDICKTYDTTILDIAMFDEINAQMKQFRREYIRKAKESENQSSNIILNA